MSNLDDNSVRKIVASYHKIQEAKDSIEYLLRDEDDIELVELMLDSLDSIESIIKRPLTNYSTASVVGEWCINQYGLGPVLTAGVMSHVDITKANTAGALWRYAGFEPSLQDSPKVSFNGELKNICWKIGLNFAKYANRTKCFYGQLYLRDRTRRTEDNNNLMYADRAYELLDNVSSKNKPNIASLSMGKLPQEQIDAQARRFAIKMFLSHYHAIAYQEYYNTVPDSPSFIYIDGEKEEVQIPNNPFKQ